MLLQVGLSGLSCGPLAIICSPLIATTAWFATDVIITTGDEMLNRKIFKNEINQLLDEQKYRLKMKYKMLYKESFQRFIQETKNKINSTPIVERVKIKDKITQ